MDILSELCIIKSILYDLYLECDLYYYWLEFILCVFYNQSLSFHLAENHGFVRHLGMSDTKHNLISDQLSEFNDIVDIFTSKSLYFTLSSDVRILCIKNLHMFISLSKM